MNTIKSSDSQEFLSRLEQLGLTRDEAKIYLELYRAPSTHLQLSRSTGVNRTKVYRLVDALAKRGIVARRTDDRGMFLTASDLAGLEVKLVAQENKVKSQRQTLRELVTDLTRLKNGSEKDFFIQTYEGSNGYKQMCWHELRTKGELLSFGNGTVEEEASDKHWSHKHRQKQIEAGYKTFEITNYDYNTQGVEAFTADALLDAGLYEHRRLSPDILVFDGQTLVYNDTVAIYHWKHEKKVGIEIISSSYAEMMRQIFWHYWGLAEDHLPFEG